MNAKLVTPNLGSLDDEPTEMPAPTPPPRPELRVPPRRSEPRVDSLVRPGFVTDAVPVPEPTEPTEVLTIEVPRRLKRALLAEVAERKDDAQRRTVASMKSVILEALTAYGFSQFINRSDIEVQAGIFMKRQAAQLRKRGVGKGDDAFIRLIVSTHRDATGLYRESLRVGVLREAARATPEARLRRRLIHREGRTLPGHQLDFAGRVELEMT